ncbi:hypothetical protein JAAARDRAFT_29277 [Jaapia argillacea MUCL 33604]|uniref:Uncharacterized protein n=1 Tax=Jaapia argillacea MUCL 33604 TaxID=933084 RepID=A0A067Q883_9AGAM|nr:hypothetical protein JAAARDRAFT_29277 [Jaapia argillacea MUCL 33604]
MDLKLRSPTSYLNQHLRVFCACQPNLPFHKTVVQMRIAADLLINLPLSPALSATIFDDDTKCSFTEKGFGKVDLALRGHPYDLHSWLYPRLRGPKSRKSPRSPPGHGGKSPGIHFQEGQSYDDRHHHERRVLSMILSHLFPQKRGRWPDVGIRQPIGLEMGSRKTLKTKNLLVSRAWSLPTTDLNPALMVWIFFSWLRIAEELEGRALAEKQ